MQSKTSLLSSGKKQNVKKSEYALSKYNYSNGAGWCHKRDHRIANKGKGQTSGQTKGNNCQASAFFRYCATTSRSYKHPNYANFLEHSRANDQARR